MAETPSRPDARSWVAPPMTVRRRQRSLAAMSTERFETVIIGGGQAGLSVGRFLRELDRPFAILDARTRIGDTWRGRWDSMRLFTPARRDGLPGLRFPARGHSFPTAGEMA